jgi:hypothetical protein
VGFVLAQVAAWSVAIAVGWSLRATGYNWLEVILTSFFCGLPVFFLGVWLTARNED